LPAHRKPRVSGTRPEPSFERKRPRPANARPGWSVEREPARAVKATPRERAPLTASQKRYLRGLAHDLKAVIQVGQKGVTPALLSELDSALAFHELIKIKLAGDDRESRSEAIEQIRASSGAEVVQTIGKVACFYRFNPDRAQFDLPR
jgi:RNA-binding protein